MVTPIRQPRRAWVPHGAGPDAVAYRAPSFVVSHGAKGLDRTLRSCCQSPLRRRCQFGGADGSSLWVTQEGCQGSVSRMFGFVLFSTIVDPLERSQSAPYTISGSHHSWACLFGFKHAGSRGEALFRVCTVASAARSRGIEQGARCCCRQDSHRTELRVDHLKL
jgi:hypothetical protein